MSKKESFGSKKILATIISCFVIWGVTIGLCMISSTAAMVFMAICAVFGWKTLNMITPAFFLWMPLLGWVIYFIVKFFLSMLIGLFVAPFRISAMIAGSVNDIYEGSLDE